MPPKESTGSAVVPPPISTTIEPVGSVTGSPAPIAAAIGSSIRNTRRAPALSADSWIARRSTAVEQGPDRLDIAGGAPEHLLGFLAHREDLLAPLDLGDRDDRRFVEDDAAPFDIDEGVRRAEVDRHVRRQQAEHLANHSDHEPKVADPPRF